MDIDEAARFELHERLREVLGATSGDTLMRAIDPGTRANVATQADLAAVEARMDDRMDERFASFEARMDERFDMLEARLTATFHQEMNRQIWTMIGSMLTLAAVLTANNIW